MTTSPISIHDLCQMLGVEPPADRAGWMIAGIATLDHATAQHVSFVQKEKYLEQAGRSKASLILAGKRMTIDHPGVVLIDDVMAAVVAVLNHFHPEPPSRSFRHPSAVVAESASLASDVFIGAGVVIGENVKIGSGTRIEAQCFLGDDVVIGADCRIFPNVTLLERVRLGNRVRIHSGTVLGADGFRYEVVGRALTKIPQVGTVVVEDDVEIGANATIDRAFIEETVIGARTKIDNLVQIGHNCIIGPDCIIVSQVGIAGSVKIGRGVVIGGKSAVKDHVKIGNGVRIGGASMVQNDVPDGTELLGSPAVSVKTYARFIRFYKDFSLYRKGLNALKEKAD